MLYVSLYITCGRRSNYLRGLVRRVIFKRLVVFTDGRLLSYRFVLCYPKRVGFPTRSKRVFFTVRVFAV